MSGPRCDARGPGGKVCGTRMVERRTTFGRLDWDCPRCERRRLGLCADCPQPVDGKVGVALRCATCRKLAHREDKRRYMRRDPEHIDQLWREGSARQRARLRHGAPPMPLHESGRLGGIRRAAALSPKRRSEIARKAIKARWARVRAAQQAQQSEAA